MHIIEQIGSYAGLAAVVGLAVLSVLYFSQARDVRRLREWAGRAPERAEAGQPVPASVAHRVVAQPQQKAPTPGQPAPTPAPAQAATTPGQAVPAPAGTGAAPPPVPGVPAVSVPAVAAAAGARPATATASAGPGPATPAGQGQHAPQAETEQKTDEGEADTGEGPAASEGEEEVKATTVGEEGVSTAATATSPIGGGERSPIGDRVSTATPGEEPSPIGDRASTAATDTRDSTEETDAVPPIAAATAAATKLTPAATAGAATPAAQGRTPVTPPPPSASPRLPERSAPPPRVSPGSATQIIPPSGRPSLASSTAPQRASLSGARLAALIVAGVLVIGGGAAFGISQLTSDDDTPAGDGGRSAASNSGDGDADAKTGGPALDPSTVTVAVLNGTLVPGLAANIGDEVESSGFDLGTVANSSDQEQQRAESVVLYAKGHQREATAVGRRLKIPQREAIDPDTQALAGDASVVVIAGSDLTQ